MVKWVCDYCRTELSPRDKVCPNCGAPAPEYPVVVSAPKPPPSPPKPYSSSQPVSADPTSDSLGVTGFIFGLVGLFLSWVPFLGLVVALTGLILSVFGRKQSEGKSSLAGVGIGFSVVALIIAIILTVVFLSGGFD